MLAPRTTGVQGVASKFLLGTDEDGRWFPDLALPDERAREHWLVKLPRGNAEPDRAVLRHEAAYLRVATACGLRSTAEPELNGEALFVRRFDRQVIDGQVHRLVRRVWPTSAACAASASPAASKRCSAACVLPLGIHCRKPSSS